MGFGICRTCGVKEHDVFYVVTNPLTNSIKFGVTSGDPRPRLKTHAKDGYTEVHVLYGELPEGNALALESHIKTTLKGAGLNPIRGREYFPRDAFAVILDIASGWISHYSTTKTTLYGLDIQKFDRSLNT